MKRITSLILALVMTAALLAGCGGDSSTAEHRAAPGDAGAAEDGGYTAQLDCGSQYLGGRPAV